MQSAREYAIDTATTIVNDITEIVDILPENLNENLTENLTEDQLNRVKRLVDQVGININNMYMSYASRRNAVNNIADKMRSLPDRVTILKARVTAAQASHGTNSRLNDLIRENAEEIRRDVTNIKELLENHVGNMNVGGRRKRRTAHKRTQRNRKRTQRNRKRTHRR